MAVGASKRRFEEAIINLIIALEILLCPDTRKIRRDLGNRFPPLIGKNKEKDEIFRIIGKLYGLRIAIIHGSRKKPLRSDVKTLFSYPRGAIIRCLSLGLYSQKGIVEEIDENLTAS